MKNKGYIAFFWNKVVLENKGGKQGCAVEDGKLERFCCCENKVNLSVFWSCENKENQNVLYDMNREKS